METQKALGYEQLSSEELAVNAGTGLDDCFSELVLRHRNALLNFIRSKGSNKEDAEDLTQETFSRAHQKINLFDPTRKFETWLFTIGTRLAASYHRKKKLNQASIIDSDHVDLQCPASIISRIESHGNLWETISEILPASQMEVMWCRYGEDMSVKGIAKKTGRTQVYVKVLLHRARTKLAKHLRTEQGDYL